MKKLNLKDVSQYVEKNIETFHEKRIQSLDSLKLSKVLKRKNPCLFKAKYVMTTEQIIRGIVDAHISSSEEGIFGDWLEGLAIFINEKVPPVKRDEVPVIEINGEIAGIFATYFGRPNRVAEDYMITNSTRKVLICCLSPIS